MQKQAKRRVREIEGILNLRKVAACRSLFLGHNCTNKVFLLQLQRYFSCLSLCLGQNSKVSILQLQSISLAEAFFLATIALTKYLFCNCKVFLLPAPFSWPKFQSIYFAIAKHISRRSLFLGQNCTGKVFILHWQSISFAIAKHFSCMSLFLDQNCNGKVFLGQHEMYSMLFYLHLYAKLFSGPLIYKLIILYQCKLIR